MGERDDRIDELYEAALKRPLGERAEFVSKHSGGDADVQRRVAALLAGQQDTQLPGYDGAADGAGVLATGTLIGSYRIDGPVGAGGMGVVYKATDTKLNRPAAIKVLPESLADSEARRRFQREAQMVSSLNHPHIVTVYDAGEYLDRQYLITEYVDGGTLRHWAARPRGWLQIVELLIGVADGIAAAHDAGILHRDIKPENILLAKNGYAKLADFGIAKLLEVDPFADEPLSAVRAAGHSSLVGTAAYMSPEQAQGLPLDARSDVYSFGLMLYELLMGSRPFSSLDPRERRSAAETVPPLDEQLPAELRAVVAKTLEREPADRYQTMRDLVVDLRRLVRRSGVETGDSAPLDSSTRRTGSIAGPVQRPWLRRVAYAALALSGVAVAGSFARDYFRDPQEAVAVLPFVNETGDPADDYISESMADALRSQLMGVENVRVVSRNSSISFRDQSEDLETIASRLGATVLVNGTVQRRGRTFTVLVEIVDSRGLGLKSERYEAEERGLLRVQQQIAAQVAQFLAPGAAFAAAAPTTEREAANTLVQLGSHYEYQVRDTLSLDVEQLKKAIGVYEQATAIDPTSVAAHGRLAGAYLYLGDVESAREPLQKALALAQSTEVPAPPAEASDTYYSLALYLLRIRATEGVDTAYEQSIRLNPNNADALRSYAQWLMTHGRPVEADEFFLRSIDLDRQNPVAYADYGELLGAADRADDLLELASTVETRLPNASGHLVLARLHELAGEIDVGIAWALKGFRAQPDNPDMRGQVAELYARIGLFEKALEFEPAPGVGQLFLQRRYGELADLAEELMIERPDDVKVIYLLGFAYHATGRYAQAKRVLELQGLPEISHTASSTSADDEALVTYIDVLQALGDEARAKQVASEHSSRNAGKLHPSFRNGWWVASNFACKAIVLGDIDLALGTLDRLGSARALASSPLMMDRLCYRRIAQEPRYVVLIQGLEERQRVLRERLPATLAEHGVADVSARSL